MLELRRAVVAITGAAGGIGQALAWRFAAKGSRVALIDLPSEALEGLAAKLREAGHDALMLPCDLTDQQACVASFETLTQDWGEVDVLINNAGISHRSLFVDTDIAVIRKVMEVNFFGSVYCTNAVLDQLIARRGHIVVISTVAGIAPLVGRTGYAASKHALHGFFDTLRAELHHTGVGVSIVCPWFVATSMRHNAMSGDGSPVTAEKAEVGRALTPDEVAEAVIEAVQQRRRLVMLSPMGKVAYWLSRLVPPGYEHMMRRSQRREFMPDE